MKTALLTGRAGQDGAYLARFFLDKGYEVHGVKRRSYLFNTQRVDAIYQSLRVRDKRFFLHYYGDLSDSTNIIHSRQVTAGSSGLELGGQPLHFVKRQSGGFYYVIHRHFHTQ
jgi:GDPmannose 4,6-dehydratase